MPILAGCLPVCALPVLLKPRNTLDSRAAGSGHVTQFCLERWKYGSRNLLDVDKKGPANWQRDMLSSLPLLPPEYGPEARRGSSPLATMT